jgi:glycosyltransferase involved in cell wall biosynthesis
VCVPPEDPEAMAAAIVELAENPGKVAELRATARSAAPQFSRDQLAERMAEILDAVGRR